MLTPLPRNEILVLFLQVTDINARNSGGLDSGSHGLSSPSSGVNSQVTTSNGNSTAASLQAALAALGQSSLNQIMNMAQGDFTGIRTKNPPLHPISVRNPFPVLFQVSNSSSRTSWRRRPRDRFPRWLIYPASGRRSSKLSSRRSSRTYRINCSSSSSFSRARETNFLPRHSSSYKTR